jgi:MFS family permease
VFVAPVAGRMTDKVGGKYILMTGLTLFAVGMGITLGIAQTTSSWQDFLLPLIVAGVGMGGTFAPLTTTAMRNVEPRMAGAASGVLNTVRQVGTVIGTAAVGALLQNRLVASWGSEAATRSAGLPGPVRAHFITGFRGAARSGLQVGAGQTGTPVRLPPGSPPGLLHQIELIGRAVFTHGFVDAMRWTMIMPVGMLLLAAAICLAIRQPRQPGRRLPAEAATEAKTSA